MNHMQEKCIYILKKKKVEAGQIERIVLFSEICDKSAFDLSIYFPCQSIKLAVHFIALSKD